MRVVAALAALEALLLAVLLAGTLTGSGAAVAVGGLAAVVVQVLLHRRLTAALPKQAVLLRGFLAPRVLLVDLLVVAHLLRSDELSAGAEVLVVLGVVVLGSARLAQSALQVLTARLRLRRADLRGLPGAPPPLPGRSRLLDEPGVLLLAAATALLPASVGWAAATGSYALTTPAVAVSAVLGLAVVLAVVPPALALVRLPRGAALLRAVHEAVLQHEPEVVLHSSGGPADLHWVLPWLGVLEELGRPCVVLLRNLETLAVLPPTRVPMLALPEAADVLPFRLPTARVALFVSNSGENVRLLRNPTLRSAFVGHGDSDKGASANPLTKMYDEVWVAGEAGRRRYVAADVGVRPEGVRVVGRPQAVHVQQQGPGPVPEVCTVLYAPTWEGLARDPHESSLRNVGRDVVRVLLGLPGVRVVFRPHPSTGRHDAGTARAAVEVTALLEQAGGRHETLRGNDVDLYALFNRVDVLVADVSAVVTDFLASEKPYFMVNGRGLPDADFRARNPTAGAAYLVGPGAEGLRAGLLDAQGADSLRTARSRLREDLIGPPVADGMQAFRTAVDALAARSPAAREPADPTP